MTADRATRLARRRPTEPGTTTDRSGSLLLAVARMAAIAVLPVLAGLYAGAVTFGGSLLPWRPTMVDLDVYRRAGVLLVQGGDVYNLPGQLPFLYPPFAALLAVPLGLLPSTLVQVAWTVTGVLAVLAVLHRFGLSGWALSIGGTVTVLLVTPVSQTLAYGQLGILLVALVVLDLVPGPRILPRRVLPEGALTALAAAVKLTPGIFLVYLVAVGKLRAAGVMVATGLAVTLASAVVLPAESLTFWGRLAQGETGLGHSIIYYTNQSVMADIVRIFGLGPGVALAGLAASAAVAALGVWSAAWWHRLGEVPLAVSVCGVASLLASPVSWLHHFVWVVPLALTLLLRVSAPPARVEGAPPSNCPRLAAWWCVLAWLFVVWVIQAPFQRLPNGADVELTWTWQQNSVASCTAVLGLALLVGSIVLAGQWRRQRPGPAQV